MGGEGHHLRQAFQAQVEVLVDVLHAHQVSQAVEDDLGVEPFEEGSFVPVLFYLVLDDPVEIGIPHVGQEHADNDDGDGHTAQEHGRVGAQQEAEGDQDDGYQSEHEGRQQDEDLLPDAFALEDREPHPEQDQEIGKGKDCACGKDDGEPVIQR